MNLHSGKLWINRSKCGKKSDLFFDSFFCIKRQSHFHLQSAQNRVIFAAFYSTKSDSLCVLKPCLRQMKRTAFLRMSVKSRLTKNVTIDNDS